MVNQSLTKRQNLSQEDIFLIEELHTEVDEIVKIMKDLDPLNDNIRLKELYQAWTDIQFKLQRAWKFTEDISYHRSWYLPHCTCPTMDNNERVGYEMIINITCPIHGK